MIRARNPTAAADSSTNDEIGDGTIGIPLGTRRTSRDFTPVATTIIDYAATPYVREGVIHQQ